MKKIFIIILLLVLSFSVGFFVIRSNSERIAQVIQSNGEEERASELQPEEIDDSSKDEEQNNNIEVEKNIESQVEIPKETTPTKSETKTNTKEANNKNVKTTNETKQEKTNTKENTQKTSSTQVEQPASKETSTTQNKKLEEIKEKLSCKDGKHYMDVGNSGKWFDTESEAIAYYKSIIKEWGDKLESFDDYKSEEYKKFNEEYNKKCPCRYETSSCFCGKWTIDFEYRK